MFQYRSLGKLCRLIAYFVTQIRWFFRTVPVGLERLDNSPTDVLQKSVYADYGDVIGLFFPGVGTQRLTTNKVKHKTLMLELAATSLLNDVAW